MANVLVDDQYLKNIGDAIRSKNNSSLKYKPSEMANMIRGLQIGDPSINVYSNDAWKYNIDQKDHQTINIGVAVSVSGNNTTGYFSELCFIPSISSNYGYNAGTIRKTIDEINHIANFTADDATALDGYITDGWAGVYVINNNYYRNSGSSTAPKLEQVSLNSSIENLLILGYYTDTTLSTPITTNTVAGYAPSSESSLKKYQNKYATSIGDSAFNYCNKLTSIDVSNATSIGNYAFNYCNKLTSIDVSNATSIGNSAFSSCSALTSIDVSNATSIGDSAFYSCIALTSIDLSNATSIGNYAFNYCNKLTSIDVSNATSIGNSAFSSCSALTSIDVSNATSIGNYAFNYCSALTSIDLSNATSIGDSAFYSCNKLTSIDLSNATSIGDSAFSSCSALTSIDVSNATSIGNSAFYSCNKLTSIDLSNATSIGDSAFYSCNKLTSIDLSNATSIGDSAFYSCIALKYIVIDNNTVSKARIKPPTGAKVLIPQSMMKTYSSDSYWSSYASQLDAIENYTITRENGQITVTPKKY